MSQTAITIPDFEYEVAPHMSNFDHSIDDGMEEALRAAPNRARSSHAAWDFCGVVWFDGERFVEQVKCYGATVDVIAADTLADLMAAVNAVYGDE